MQIKTIEEFRNKFKCIQSDCDGQGNIPYQVKKNQWEAGQCQFHAEYLFPIESFLTQDRAEIATALIEALEEAKKRAANFVPFQAIHHQEGLKEAQNIIRTLLES